MRWLEDNGDEVGCGGWRIMVTRFGVVVGGFFGAASLKYSEILFWCLFGRGAPNGFQDVAFLSTRTSFSTTYLKNCGRGESL